MKSRLMFIVATSVFIGVAGMVASSHASGQGGGTDILHFFVRKAMSPEGSNTNATGFVSAKQNKQGNANNQKLDITAASLNAAGSYLLFALLGNDTNFTFVTQFDTDTNGAAAFHYQKNSSNQGQGQGKGKTPLPTVLNPISNIRELAIANTTTQIVLVTTQVVLRADLTAPDKLQYLVKRKLTNDGADPDAEGTLRIKATENFVQFHLQAERLDPSTNFLLVIYGNVVSTNASDANGELRIDGLPAGVPDILDIHSVAIWNSASNSVLSTLLP
ncbi:MAG: hypothetical protein HY298_24125 [Verrucomicrobia bacterium]|nr:hypothetical protein [Verrucomicrobiota bacterium]